MEKQINFVVDGKKIYGMWHYPEKKKFPVVVSCHGFTGNKNESHFLFVKFARILCDSGIAMLRFDFRGSGESEGKFSELTVNKEIKDTLAAINFVYNLPGIDQQRIGLLGLSLGGCVAFNTANRWQKTKFLVLWAAVADPKWVLLHNKDVMQQMKKTGYYDFGGNVLTKLFLQDLDTIPKLHQQKQYKNPVLIVHGAKDPTVPASHAKAYKQHFDNNGNLNELVILPEGDHTFASAKLEPQVFAVTFDWLKTQTTIGA